MANVFDGLQGYGESWKVVDSRKFEDAEKSMIRSNEVVTSDYGLSVCFHMTNGISKYIGLSRDSKLQIGDSLDVNNATLLTLTRDGKSCLRVQEM